MCSVIITDDLRGAFRQMKPQIALYVGGMGHRDKNFHADMMTRRGYGDVAQTIQELFLSGRKGEAIEAVPDEFCDEGSLVGPPARIRERYRAWEDSGATGLTISGDDAAMDLMAEITGIGERERRLRVAERRTSRRRRRSGRRGRCSCAIRTPARRSR